MPRLYGYLGTAADKVFRHLFELTNKGYAKYESPPYMPLSVERIGTDTWAVSHTYVQNGDLMRDPEIVFKLVNETIVPIEYRQDNLGVVIYYDEIKDLVKRHECAMFCVTWAKNIKQQFPELFRKPKKVKP